jgi:transcriptional regulator with XRE-family HTH domain
MDVERFGRSVRAVRIRRGWRQGDLAAEARVSRSVVGRIERGLRAGLTLDDVDAVATALGATAKLALAWHGEALDRLLDEAHARLVEETVRRLRGWGWQVAVEVTFSMYGERGSIDVLAFHPETRMLLVVEVKSVVPDMQATLGGVDRKARLGERIARERGWHPIATARVLVIWATRTNRRRAARVEATIRAALPAGTRAVTAWLAAPTPEPIAGTWFVTDGHSEASTGVRATRVRRGRGGTGVPTASGASRPETS